MCAYKDGELVACGVANLPEDLPCDVRLGEDGNWYAVVKDYSDDPLFGDNDWLEEK